MIIRVDRTGARVWVRAERGAAAQSVQLSPAFAGDDLDAIERAIPALRNGGVR